MQIMKVNPHVTPANVFQLSFFEIIYTRSVYFRKFACYDNNIWLDAKGQRNIYIYSKSFNGRFSSYNWMFTIKGKKKTTGL